MNKINDVCLTSSQILSIIETEILTSGFKKDDGIYQTSDLAINDTVKVSIGMSLEETEDGKDVYIFNLFIGKDEYVNISSVGNEYDKIPTLVLDEIRQELLKLV